MGRALARWLDVRSGEERQLGVFFAGLMTIVVGLTLVETARDSLFLLHVGARDLGATYVVNAIMALVGGAVSAGLTTRVGPHRALRLAQPAAALAVAAYAFLPPTRAVLGSLYGVTALVGTVLVPQLWAAAAVAFQATQVRRLLAVVALAGIVGGTAGALLAAGALLVMPIEWLLVLGGGFFLASSAATALAAGGVAPRRTSTSCDGPRPPSPFKEEPILVRIAVATALGAVTALLVDYAYKSALVEVVPRAEIGRTLALVGAATNALALVAQLGLARVVVARGGIVGANGFASSLLFLGSALVVVTGGGLLAVLAARVAEGATRHSVHRTATELLYLAVPAGPRNRAKPLIEGAVARGAQAVAGGGLLALAAVSGTPVVLVALFSAVAAALWGAATYGLWQPYLALLRRSLGGGTLDAADVAEQLDLASVDILVEALGSPDPRQVIGALRSLERRGRSGLVPAVMLLHDDEEVLEVALGMFAASSRRDWIRFARQRAGDRRWRVRRAALRALTLARSRDLDVAAPGGEEHPWTRGYLAVAAGSVAETVGAIASPADARDALLGVLTAIGDGARTEDPEGLLRDVAAGNAATRDEEVVEAIARAAAATGARSLLPWLVSRLARREGRAAVRRALVAMGQPAFDAVAEALASGAARRDRVQLPRVLAAFGTRAAGEALFAVLSSDADGLVRYRCLQALETLVERRQATFPAARVRPLAHRALAEHFRLLGLRAAIAAGEGAVSERAATAHRQLVRLLGEKAQQSLMRAYLVIGLAFPDEDMRHAHAAATGADAASRATAAELVDALLVPRRGRRARDELRDWLRLAVDDLPDDERAARAGTSSSADEAAARLAADADPIVRALAGAALLPAPVAGAARSAAMGAPVELVHG